MAVKKKVVAKKVAVLPKHMAPLSQRPYVTMAILVALVIGLALTIELIQDYQIRNTRNIIHTPVYQILK